jgi:peptide/nickel transport system substrate-binding protein
LQGVLVSRPAFSMSSRANRLGTADLPYLLADYHLGILPSTDGKVDMLSGIGAGPFKVDNFQAGVQATFSQHKNYHGQAYFDAVRMLGINDANARINALMAGELDAISDVDLKTEGLLSQQPDIQLDEVPSGQAVSMDMQCDVAPFDKNDVRMALKYAIDRKEIVDKIAMGHATAVWTQWPHLARASGPTFHGAVL